MCIYIYLYFSFYCFKTRKKFLPWFICPLYFPSYFLLTLEWSCFINSFSFSSVFNIFLFVVSFLSTCKHIQVFLLFKACLFIFPFLFHPCKPFPAKLLKRTVQSHWHCFFTIQFPSLWSLVNASMITLKLLIKTHQSLPGWWIW